MAEKRFQAFTEHTAALVFIKDADGRYLYSNREHGEFTGGSPNYRHAMKWPEELKRVLKEHDALALKTGKWLGEETVLDRNGQPCMFQVSKFRIPQEEGIFLIGGIAIDITEKQKLDQDRRRLATILEQLGEGVMVTETDGTIVFVNRAFEEIAGYSQKELIGQNSRILKSGRQDEKFYRELWDTVVAGRAWKGVMENRRKDGSFYHEQATIFPVRDETGAIIQYAAIMRDITRELEMEETIYQSQKLETIGQLVAGIAHDFNNILTAISGYSGLAISSLEPGSKVRSHVEKVRDAGERAAALTRSLLGFGRKQMIQPRVLDISEEIRKLESLAKRMIGEDIELVLKLGKEIPPVFADPTQIDQVLMNLLVNSRDAIHDAKNGGERKIIIETSEAELDESYVNTHVGSTVGPHVLLNVTDTGKGIPVDIQLKIFEPFYTTKKSGLGTGLGLATVYGIVKQNNGSIFLYSEEGQGATFKIYWPVYQPEGMVSEIRKEFPMDNSAIRGDGVILIVEDEESVLSTARAVLETAGYTILEAESAEKALEMMESYEGPLDLLFTDIVMPGMNGMQLAEKLSEMRPGLKTLYASGYSEAVLEQRGLQGLDASLLLKPYSQGELTRRIQNLLNQER